MRDKHFFLTTAESRAFSKAVVLLLLIHCLLLLPLFVGFLCSVIVRIVIQYFVSF